MSIEDCKEKPRFRIPLTLFMLMQLNDDSIDCCDTEIDTLIGVERDIYHDEEFPLMEQCTQLIRDLVDVVGLNPVTVDISSLLHHNKEICREWVKENWNPEYQGLMDEDDGEWESQFIESFNLIMAGHFGEKIHARYVKLLTQFKRVPASSDEYIIVPHRATVDAEPKDQLTKAKEIIENLLGVLPDEVLHHDYYRRICVEPAEQFLKEVTE